MSRADGLELERGRGGKPYFDNLIDTRARVRELFAELLGTTPEHVALTASTTMGCQIVLSGLRLEPGDEIVTTDEEHFGLLGPLHVSGARVRVAATRGRTADEALEAVLAEVGPRTRLVALSHVSWMTGHVLPVDEIKAQTGVPLLVDGAQSVGAIPVELGDADFYTVSGQKWLCGPDATGALYVRDLDALAVALPTYWSREAHEPDGAFEPVEGAQRFDTGPIPVPSLAGLEVALQTAPPSRYDDARAITERCRELLSERFDVVTAPGPGDARHVRARRRLRRHGRSPLRRRRRRERDPGDRLGARLVRLLEHRGAPAAARSTRSELDGAARPQLERLPRPDVSVRAPRVPRGGDRARHAGRPGRAVSSGAAPVVARAAGGMERHGGVLGPDAPPARQAGRQADGHPPRQAPLVAHGPGERDRSSPAAHGDSTTADSSSTAAVFAAREARRLGLGVRVVLAWTSERRVAQALRITTASGSSIVLLHLHLTHLRDRRLAEAELRRAVPSPRSSQAMVSRSWWRATSTSARGVACGCRSSSAAGFSPAGPRHRPRPRARGACDAALRVARRAPHGRRPRALRPPAGGAVGRLGRLQPELGRRSAAAPR